MSLDRQGAVDLPFIATLYGKPEERVIAELGDLIYLDPETQTWQTADAVPLRQRPGEARRGRERRPGLCPQRRGSAQPCSPRTCSPATSTPTSGPRGYRNATSRRSRPTCLASPPRRSRIGHLKKDAVWSIDAGYQAEQSVAATSDYGTPRANGGTWLLELALNLKTPVIYDTVQTGDREERVVNQEATLAAREKQKRIKERFRAWVFADPERTEQLVRLYNDTYNNLRPRLFDGSPPRLPGDEPDDRPRPHQADAVWRGMSCGQHAPGPCVGAGKTFTMAATGMKMKQAGLITEADVRGAQPHARAVRPRVPAALSQRKLLVAGKEDLSRDRRKILTAKIASGEWDGIIVTHSSLRADRHEPGLPGAIPARADRRVRPAPLRLMPGPIPPGAHETSSRPSRSRRPTARSASKTSWPRTRRTMAWCSTSLAWITSSSTRPTSSRTSRPRPRWTGSPASRPAAPSEPSTST